MKKFILLAFLIPVLVSAQAPTQISEGLASWLDVPYLVNGNTSQQGQRFKFDKKIKVETNNNGTASEMFIFINTKNGNYAFMTGKPGTLGNGEFNYGDRNFMLNFFTQKGEFFQFYNDKVKGEIKHFAGTNNTIISAIQFPSASGTLPKKSQTQTSVNGFTAHAYGTGQNNFYLIGSNSKQKLKITKFLGYSGIGYVKTDGGIQMITEMNTPNSFITAVSWENINVEFNAELFTESREGDFYAKATENIEQKKEKANNMNMDGPCSGIKMDIQTLELENARKQKEGLEKTSSGNLFEGGSQQGLGELANILGGMEKAKLENELKICNMQHQNSNSQGIQQKIECRSNLRTTIDNYIEKIRQAEITYDNNPALMIAEQSKLFMEYGKVANSCN